MKNKPLLIDIFEFVLKEKKWWLIPIFSVLLIVGALIVFGQSSALSPFIYALG